MDIWREINPQELSFTWHDKALKSQSHLDFFLITADLVYLTKESSRIFIVMLHLYGTREDTKIWAKIISAHAKKCSRMEVSVAEGRWVGQERGLCSDLSGHER